jgi:hypothetical protein
MRVLIPILLAAIVAGCTVLKSDPVTKVNEFLAEFQDKLDKTTGEDQILALFQSAQSKESILSAIGVLRNTEYPAVSCAAYFGQAVILNDSTGLRVEIPALLSVDTLSVQASYNALFTLWLKESNGGFVVSRLDAEDFYNMFLQAKGEAAWVLDEQQVLEEHKRYFRIARLLQEMYDTAAFVATYNDDEYYYVAMGEWDIEGKGDGKMGIVDSTGQVIIPLEYTIIGNPGLVADDIVEVNKDGVGTGYFDIVKRKMIIEPEYTWIIPYDKGKVYALAMNDTIGWINRNYQFVPGFPDAEAKEFYTSFSYFPSSIEFSAQTRTMLESPHENRFGSGVIFTPSYLTEVLEMRYTDFSLDGQAYRASTESVTADKSFLGEIADHFNVFLTSVTSRYLEGREEFYSKSQVNFVNNNGKVLLNLPVQSSDVSFKVIDSTTLEVKVVWDISWEYNVDEPGDINVPEYTYYDISSYEVPQRRESNREFEFTRFAKMDSSYIKGSFSYYNNDTQTMETREFMGEETLIAIRADLLAAHGFAFDDPATVERLQAHMTYAPLFKTREEILPYLSEIERYNLEFLDRLIDLVSGVV